MDTSVLMSIEGGLAVIIVLIAIIMLKRIQARARDQSGAPDIVLRTDADTGADDR